RRRHEARGRTPDGAAAALRLHRARRPLRGVRLALRGVQARGVRAAAVDEADGRPRASRPQDRPRVLRVRRRRALGERAVGSGPRAAADGVPYPASLTAEALRAAFEPPSAMTVGIEEELMLVDARTFELRPFAHEVLAAAGDDPRFKPELPAAQLEIAVPPAASVPEAAAGLARARADIAAIAAPGVRLAAAGAHPFSAPEGPVHPAPRYARLEAEFGAVIRHQLLFGLHVHVAVRPAGR